MMYIVRIKSCLCCNYQTVNEYLIQPKQYLKAFSTASEAQTYRTELDQRTILPPVGVSPFIIFCVWEDVRPRAYSNRQERLGYQEFMPPPVIESLTSFSENSFISELQALGLDCPTVHTYAPLNPSQGRRKQKKHQRKNTQESVVKYRPWHTWWLQTELKLDFATRQAVWKLLDKLDMFEIVTVPMEK